MARSVDDYTDLFFRLCPPSIWGLWSRAHATLLAFGRASSGIFAWLDGRASQALEESFPNTADETLAAWEYQLGITDPPSSTADRQALCGAKFAAKGGPLVPAYIRTVCEAFGYDPGDITITEPASGFPAFRCGVGACGDPIGGGGAEAHSFLVTYPSPTNAEMEALINDIKPVHTTAYFTTV